MVPDEGDSESYLHHLSQLYIKYTQMTHGQPYSMFTNYECVHSGRGQFDEMT